MGVKVLKFDGAIAPRVLKFDSGFAAEGCGIDAFGVDEYIAASRRQRYGPALPPNRHSEGSEES